MSSKFSNFNFVSLEESSDNFESYHRWTCWKLQPTFLKLSDEQRRVTTPSCVNCQEKKQGFCKFFLHWFYMQKKQSLTRRQSYVFSKRKAAFFRSTRHLAIHFDSPCNSQAEQNRPGGTAWWIHMRGRHGTNQEGHIRELTNLWYTK